MEILWSERGYFGLSGKTCIFDYYPIIAYQRVKVYEVETMDMELFHRNNGVSEKFNPSKYRGTYCTGLDHFSGVIMRCTMTPC